MPTTTLFVVIDPTTSEQMSLKRAEQLAVDTGARLHLFCCDYAADISAYSSRKDARRTVLERTRITLEALAEPLRREGLQVTTEAYWNSDWQESIVRACGRAGAGMVIKSSFYHTSMQRHFKRTSDYTLLRKSPCATLLVKDDGPWTEQVLLAALALELEDEEHEILNGIIINRAQRLAKATQSQLHVVCALAHRLELEPAEALHLRTDADEELSVVEALAARYGVDSEKMHIRPGKPRDVITECAAELRADALIIGTAARKGLRALLLGNTAEKILDDLATDLLVVNH